MRTFSRTIPLLLIFLLAAFFIISGCSGGGSGLPDGSDERAKASLKMSFNTSSPDRALETDPIPSNAQGIVTVVIKDLSNAHTPSGKISEYQQGSVVFEEEFSVHSTYEVLIVAALRYSSADDFERVFIGSSEVFIRSNKEALGNPDYNQIFVTLNFSGTKQIPRVASKLVMEPAQPVSSIISGSTIPAFTVKIFDQFGSALSASNLPVTVSIPGVLLSGGVSVVPVNGVASFSGILVSNILQGTASSLNLTASYGGITVASGPISVLSSSAANTTVAGYLKYDTTTAASPVSRLISPAVGKKVAVITDGREYSTVTDPTGFWKLDITLPKTAVEAIMMAEYPNGSMGSTEIYLTGGKLYIGRATLLPPDQGKLVLVESGNFQGLIDISSMKNIVDNKFIALKNSSSVQVLAGKVVERNSSGTFLNAVGVPGATVTVSPSGASAVTDSRGFYRVAGGFTAGNYMLTVTAPQYYQAHASFAITVDDYGFVMDGIGVQLERVAEKLPTSLRLLPGSDTVEAGLNYDIGARVKTTVFYSDGSSLDVTPSWQVVSASGSLANGVYTPYPAEGRAIFRAVYSQNGVTVSSDFALNVLNARELDSLIMSKISDTAEVSSIYDLSAIIVRARYIDGSVAVIVPAWSISSGSGTISSNAYNAPGFFETAVLTAGYSENGIFKTAAFKLTVTSLAKKLIGMFFVKPPSTIEVSAVYDLSAIKTIATYSDQTTAEVLPSWSVLVGAGTITGSFYNAPAATGSSTVSASYSENGVTRNLNFTFDIIPFNSLVLNAAVITSSNNLRLNFNKAVSVQNFNPTAVMVGGVSLAPGTMAAIDIKNDPSGRTVLITTPKDFTVDQQKLGVKGGLSGTGLEFFSSNGIIDATAASPKEVPVTKVGFDISPDTYPPPAPGPLVQANVIGFSNGFSRVSFTTAINYPEIAALELGYTPAASPLDTTAVVMLAGELAFVKAHAAGDIAIKGVPVLKAGDNIYYSYKDPAGNSSGWVHAGSVPAPPDINNITWYNDLKGFKISNLPVGDSGGKMMLYEMNGVTHIFKTISNTAAAPYQPGTLTTMGIELNPNYIVSYSLITPRNIESQIVDDGKIPPAPATSISALRLGYVPPGKYVIKNSNANFEFAADANFDLGVMIGSFDSGILAAGKKITASGYSDVDFTPIDPGGNLKFVYIDPVSRNRSVASGNTFVPPMPVFGGPDAIPANDNGSGNGPNFINDVLAASVVNPLVNADNSRLAVNIGKAYPGKLEIVMVNPQAASYGTALLEATLPSAIASTTPVEFTLGNINPLLTQPASLKAALGTVSTQVNLELHLKSRSADGNDSRETPFINIAYGLGNSGSGLQFNPLPGNYPAGIPNGVTLVSPVAGAVIKYTTSSSSSPGIEPVDPPDPSDPNSAIAVTYSNPIAVPASTKMVIKAVYINNGVYSPVSLAVYNTFPAGSTNPVKPIITPVGGNYNAGQMITIVKDVLDSARTNATIKYTIDNTEPTLVNGLPYGGGFILNASMTVKAIVIDGALFSPTAFATYTVGGANTVAAPTFNPAGGSYPNAAMNVTIDCPTIGATIRYTTDGTDPATATTFQTGSAPLGVSVPASVSNYRIRAIALKATMTNSAEMSQIYSTTGGAGSSVTITNVSNGVINLNITPAPTIAPAFADFAVKQKIDGGAETQVTLSSFNGAANNPVVVLNVPLVSQTASPQNVVYMVSYKGGAYISSSPFTVPAQTGGSSVAITNVSNGVINLNITPAPTIAPAFADFAVKQKIDGGAETQVTLSSFNGAANNPAVVLNVPLVSQTANPQNVIYMVSYKSGAYVSSNSFTVPANTPPPAPTGFIYDGASTPKRLIWNPVTPPPGGTVEYKISLNGSSGPFNSVSITEYPIAPGTPAGNAELYAVLTDANGTRDSQRANVGYPASAPSLK